MRLVSKEDVIEKPRDRKRKGEACIVISVVADTIISPTPTSTSPATPSYTSNSWERFDILALIKFFRFFL